MRQVVATLGLTGLLVLGPAVLTPADATTASAPRDVSVVTAPLPDPTPTSGEPPTEEPTSEEPTTEDPSPVVIPIPPDPWENAAACSGIDEPVVDETFTYETVRDDYLYERLTVVQDKAVAAPGYVFPDGETEVLFPAHGFLGYPDCIRVDPSWTPDSEETPLPTEPPTTQPSEPTTTAPAPSTEPTPDTPGRTFAPPAPVTPTPTEEGSDARPPVSPSVRPETLPPEAPTTITPVVPEETVAPSTPPPASSPPSTRATSSFTVVSGESGTAEDSRVTGTGRARSIPTVAFLLAAAGVIWLAGARRREHDSEAGRHGR